MDNLLTAEEVAPLAKMEVQAVYRYAREGKIPSIKIGSKTRFPESALARWIESQLTSEEGKEPQAASATA